MNRYLFYLSHQYAFSIVRPLQKEIRSRGDDCAWFMDAPLAHHMKKDEILLRTTKQVMDYNPCAVLTATNVVPHFFPGIKVQLFHGFNARKRDMNRGHFRLRGFFDLYCTQGPDTTLPFQKLASRHGYFDVVETGWPKTDPLFLENGSHPFKSSPTVLFTSTFTPALSAAHKLAGEFGKIIEKRPAWHWIITLHPKMDKKIVEKYRELEKKNNNLTFSDTDDVIPLLKKSDVMLSDTSSIISEFLLLHRPVVTLNNREPGPHLINIAEIQEITKAIEQALTRPPELMSAIEKYGREIHPFRDGNSSARVMDAVEAQVKKGISHLKPKPLNLLRKFKIRRKLRFMRSLKIIILLPKYIGDSIMATPALELVKRAYPGASITVISRRINAGLFQNDSYTQITDPRESRPFMGTFELIRMLLTKQYDIGFLFSNTFLDALCFRLGLVKKTAGYKKEIRGFLLNHTLKIDRSRHYINHYAHLVNSFTGKAFKDLPKVSIPFCAENSLVRRSDKKTIGMYLGAETKKNRYYPHDQALEIIHQIKKEHDAVFIFFGDSREKKYNELVLSGLSRNDFIDLTGKTSITELVDTIADLDLLITIDSAPVHIAAATHTPFIAIVGKGTSPWSCVKPKVDFGISLEAQGKYIEDQDQIRDISPHRIAGQAIQILEKK